MTVPQETHERLQRELQEWSNSAFEYLLFVESADRWAETVSHWLVEANGCGDVHILHDGLESLESISLQKEYGYGIVSALIKVARAALDCARQIELADVPDLNPREVALLALIYQVPNISSYEAASRFHPFSVIRVKNVAKVLVMLKLVTEIKNGPELRWNTTPRGGEATRILLRRKEASGK
jgi:hypothetical protein